MEPTQYLDFDLRFQPDGEGQYRVQVVASPAGTSDAITFQLPFNEDKLENFLLKIGRPRRGTRSAGSPETTAAKDFGAGLFASVFAGDVNACLRSSLDLASSDKAGLRIRLDFTKVPELADLPWEYLYRPPPLNRFLALSTKTPLVRYLDLPERIEPLIVSLPLRILIVIASPTELTQLDTEREWTNLRAALGDLEKQGLVELIRLDRTTSQGLQRQLRLGQYNILHFIGHGKFDAETGDGALILENSEGRAETLTGEHLGRLLHDHPSLRLAVLNACEGARSSRSDPFSGMAQALLQQRVPAVIAMQFEITDHAAVSFAQEFYGAIADNYPVDAALAEARKTMARGVGIEWGTPVLYMRAPNGRVFDVRSLSDAERRKIQTDGLANAANADMTREDWPAAIEKLQVIVRVDPKHPAAPQLKRAQEQLALSKLYETGRAHFEAGKYGEAKEYFRRLKAKANDYKDVDELLARLTPTVTPSMTLRGRKLIWLAAVAAIIVVGGFVFWRLTRRSDSLITPIENRQPATVNAPTSTASGGVKVNDTPVTQAGTQPDNGNRVPQRVATPKRTPPREPTESGNVNPKNANDARIILHSSPSP